MASRVPVRGIIFYFALAIGGFWYGGKGLLAGIAKYGAGAYVAHERELAIDVITVLIQLGLGIGLSVLFVLAARDAWRETEAEEQGRCPSCGGPLPSPGGACAKCGRRR